MPEGKRRSFSGLPRHGWEMPYDAYRSLAAAACDAGAYEKTSVPLEKFRWADFFRSTLPCPDSDDRFEAIMKDAMRLAKSRAAWGCRLPWRDGLSNRRDEGERGAAALSTRRGGAPGIQPEPYFVTVASQPAPTSAPVTGSVPVAEAVRDAIELSNLTELPAWPFVPRTSGSVAATRHVVVDVGKFRNAWQFALWEIRLDRVQRFFRTTSGTQFRASSESQAHPECRGRRLR
jgi:hypothetical protein